MRCPNCEGPLAMRDDHAQSASPYRAYACHGCRCSLVTSHRGSWHVPFMRVLLLADDLKSQAGLTLMLSQLGSEVFSTADPAIALAVAEHDRPDAAFIDLIRSESPFDGLDCLRLLKEATRARPIFLFACTADPDPYTALDAIDAGASDALLKPFTRAQIIDLMVRHFSTPVPV